MRTTTRVTQATPKLVLWGQPEAGGCGEKIQERKKQEEQGDQEEKKEKRGINRQRVTKEKESHSKLGDPYTQKEKKVLRENYKKKELLERGSTLFTIIEC